jgi:hypothetical protein
MKNYAVGQAYITCTGITAGLYEFEITWVQREAHKSLIGDRPQYGLSEIKFSSVRHGATEKEHPVMFEPSFGGRFPIEECQHYVALIGWNTNPKEAEKQPHILGMVPKVEFDAVKDQHRVTQQQKVHSLRKQQEELPSFFEAQQQWRKERDVDKKLRIREAGPLKIGSVFKPFRRFVPVEEPVTEELVIDTVGVYLVEVNGHNVFGTLQRIVDHLAREWGEDPTADLMAERAVWRQRIGRRYGDRLLKAPNLPPVSKKARV